MATDEATSSGGVIAQLDLGEYVTSAINKRTFLLSTALCLSPEKESPAEVLHFKYVFIDHDATGDDLGLNMSSMQPVVNARLLPDTMYTFDGRATIDLGKQRFVDAFPNATDATWTYKTIGPDTYAGTSYRYAGKYNCSADP